MTDLTQGQIRALARDYMAPKKLKWRGGDIEGWEARASRAVGGKYRIKRSKDKDGSVYYDIHHFTYDPVRDGYGGDRWIRGRVSSSPTLEAAKAAAEQDNDRRRSGAGLKSVSDTAC
jgi:hypothetical protein